MTFASLPAPGSSEMRDPGARRVQQLRFLRSLLEREHLEAATDQDAVVASPQEQQAASNGQEQQQEAPLAPPPCAFLRPGQYFEGRQQVALGGVRKSEHWDVQVTIQGYDASRGRVTGTMEAHNVPEAAAPVVTYFEGEVVDNVHHSFFTAGWAACAQTDLRHWSRLEGFRPLKEEVVRSGGRSKSLHLHPWVFMRWKERFFVKGSESRLTIAGFYYVAINRIDGQIEGLYYDPSSSPDQKLELAAVPAGVAGHAFAHYELA